MTVFKLTCRPSGRRLFAHRYSTDSAGNVCVPPESIRVGKHFSVLVLLLESLCNTTVNIGSFGIELDFFHKVSVFTLVLSKEKSLFPSDPY